MLEDAQNWALLLAADSDWQEKKKKTAFEL